MTTQQTTKSLTIPAREVRPGDVLFGMTVKEVRQTDQGVDQVIQTTMPSTHWLPRDMPVTVERSVPSEPIDTVRVWLHEDSGDLIALYRKVGPNAWRVDGSAALVGDADVADFPILWKPGMPIPTEGAK